MTLRFLIALFMLVAFAPYAYAQEDAKNFDDIIEETLEEEKPVDTSSRYSPEFCDFEITFPEEPYTAKRCPQGAKQCYNMTSYSMVYGSSTTVDVNVTCVPSKPQNYNRYNDRVIRSALNGMVQRAQVEDFEINTEELEDIRRGSLTGTAANGNENRVYNAQLWVGQNSVMTIEAKMVGRRHTEANTTYADILKSIQRKQLEEINPSSGEEAIEEPAEEKKKQDSWFD